MKDLYLVTLMTLLGMVAIISATIISYPALAYLASKFFV